MEYSRHEIAALAGLKVTVRRYIQPTLKAGDPDREPAGEHAGTVTHIDGAGRLVLDSCPEAIWPEPAFLGGSPQHGTSRWLVTEITRDGEEAGLAMSDLNAGEHDEDSRVKAHTEPMPWCEVCEGGHADHAKWLAERAAAVARWSRSAKALEAALNESRLATLGLVREETDAGGLYGEIARLVAELRRITDAAAWRAQQDAAAAATEVPRA